MVVDRGSVGQKAGQRRVERIAGAEQRVVATVARRAQPHQARTLALRFRRHNIDQLEQTLPHWTDQAKLIASAKQGRQQLEQLFAQEREAASLQKARQIVDLLGARLFD